MLRFIKKYYLYILIFLVSNLLLIGFLYKDRSSKEQIYLEQNVQNLRSQFKATINAYNLLSDLIFDEISTNPAILASLSEAYKANDTRQATLRKKLIEHLTPTYRRLQMFSFSKFFFTFPNGSVFLRFHKTYQYGDKPSEANLNLSLEKIDTPLIQKEKSSAFSYMSPLYYKGDFVGNVKTAISFELLQKELSKIFVSDYGLIITKDAAMSAISKGGQKRFAESDLSEHFFYDKGHPDSNGQSGRDKIHQINNIIKNRIAEKLVQFQNFSIPLKLDDGWYIVTFLTISGSINKSGETIGYLISYTKDPVLGSFETAFISRLISGNLFVLLILGFVFNINKRNKQLRDMASYDTLTGIFNRREFDKTVLQEFERSKRYGRPLSLIIIDIDHFKNINDTYGHKTGDYILKTLSELVQNNIRRQDYFARWGGEEFAILTAESDASNAYQLAEKLRSILENHTFETVGNITASFGVAQYDETMSNFDELFQHTDEALYRAKENGRNWVEVH